MYCVGFDSFVRGRRAFEEIRWCAGETRSGRVHYNKIAIAIGGMRENKTAGGKRKKKAEAHAGSGARIDRCIIFG